MNGGRGGVPVNKHSGSQQDGVWAGGVGVSVATGNGMNRLTNTQTPKCEASKAD